jgi:hypothetical protein
MDFVLTLYIKHEKDNRSLDISTKEACMKKLHVKALTKEEKGKKLAENLNEPRNFCEKCFMQMIKENHAEEVSEEEWHLVLHSLGLDEWVVEYFLGFYEIFEEDLLRVLEESRTYGRILEAFNATFIALIPKVKNPTSFE